MRTKNTFINSAFTLGFQIITLLIGFVIPRWVISVYGSEVNGLTSNINQILNVVNLLQAGLVGASIFEMYKPIAENNYKVIGSIYYSSKKYFERMSIVFFMATMLMIPYFINSEGNQLSVPDIVVSVIILGFSSTFAFRYYCKYDVIFSAHQKKYILVIASIIEKVIYYLLLFVILILKVHFIWMYIAVLIGCLVRVIYLNRQFRHDYVSNIAEYKNETSHRVKNQYHLFGNQIVQNLIESLPLVFVSYFNGLKYASVLSVYLLVSNFFKMICFTLQNSVAASFGDLAATDNMKEKTVRIFGVIQIIFSSITIVVSTCLVFLYTSFVNIYTSNAADITYVYQEISSSVILYLTCSFGFLSYNLIVNSLGLYGKVLKFNILDGVVSVIVMAFLAQFNFKLVYLGAALFYGVAIIHRHIFLKKSQIPVTSKNLVNAFFSVIVVATELVIFKDLRIINSIPAWAITGILVFVITAFFSLTIICIFRRDDFHRIKTYVQSILSRN